MMAIDRHSTPRKRIEETIVVEALSSLSKYAPRFTFKNHINLSATKSDITFFDDLGLKPVDKNWTLVFVK
jgi:hypothetical protein